MFYPKGITIGQRPKVVSSSPKQGGETPRVTHKTEQIGRFCKRGRLYSPPVGCLLPTGLADLADLLGAGNRALWKIGLVTSSGRK